MHETFLREVDCELSSWTRFMRNSVFEKVATNCECHRVCVHSSDGLKWSLTRDVPSLTRARARLKLHTWKIASLMGQCAFDQREFSV